MVLTKPKDIGKYYLRTWFGLDLVSSFPVDVILLFAGAEPGDSETLRVNRMLKVLKCFRLLRVFRLARLSRIMHNARRLPPDEFGGLGLQYGGPSPRQADLYCGCGPWCPRRQADVAVTLA